PTLSAPIDAGIDQRVGRGLVINLHLSGYEVKSPCGRREGWRDVVKRLTRAVVQIVEALVIVCVARAREHRPALGQIVFQLSERGRRAVAERELRVGIAKQIGWRGRS